MQVFVRTDYSMIAATIQCDVDGAPKGSHFARVTDGEAIGDSRQMSMLLGVEGDPGNVGLIACPSSYGRGMGQKRASSSARHAAQAVCPWHSSTEVVITIFSDGTPVRLAWAHGSCRCGGSAFGN